MEMITTTGRLAPAPRAAADPAGMRDTLPPVVRRPPVPRAAARAQEADQSFVSTVRAAAPRFAAAAGSVTAVVAEAVPPARHRRARCRVVLLGADGAQTEQVFVGAAGRPCADTAVAFTDAVAGWLAGRELSGAPTPDVVVEPRE